MGLRARREHMSRGAREGVDRDRPPGFRLAGGPDQPEIRYRQHPQAHLRGAGEKKQAKFGRTLS